VAFLDLPQNVALLLHVHLNLLPLCVFILLETFNDLPRLFYHDLFFHRFEHLVNDKSSALDEINVFAVFSFAIQHVVLNAVYLFELVAESLQYIVSHVREFGNRAQEGQSCFFDCFLVRPENLAVILHR
jgi:hypothetical protein